MRSQIPAVRRGFCCERKDLCVRGKRLRSLLYGGVFVGKYHGTYWGLESQIPAVRRGFCWQKRLLPAQVSVSDPCCTAGFLLVTSLHTLQTATSQIPAVRRGFCWARLAALFSPKCLRSLLYGGVFVENGTRGSLRLMSQIPAVRRGFCWETHSEPLRDCVSDPCCTAGFLLNMWATEFVTLSLRSLLYGGVFVAQSTASRRKHLSQIPAVRRGFC